MFYWKEVLGGLDSHGPQQEDSENMRRWMLLPPLLPDQRMQWCSHSLSAEDKMNPIPSPTLALLKSRFYHCLTVMMATLYSPACSAPVAIKRRASSLTVVMIRFRGTSLVFSSFTALRSQSFSMLQPRWPLFVPWSCRGQLTQTLQLLLCLENLPFRALSWSTVTTQVITQRHQSLSFSKFTLFSFSSPFNFFLVLVTIWNYFLVGMSLIFFVWNVNS